MKITNQIERAKALIDELKISWNSDPIPSLKAGAIEGLPIIIPSLKAGAIEAESIKQVD